MLQVQLRKTWPLFLNIRILSIFTVNFLKNFNDYFVVENILSKI